MHESRGRPGGAWGLEKGTGEPSSGLSITDEDVKMQWITEEQSLGNEAEPCECRIKCKHVVLQRSHGYTGGTF